MTPRPTQKRHEAHCERHNDGRTLWYDDDGVVQGYRCICDQDPDRRQAAGNWEAHSGPAYRPGPTGSLAVGEREDDECFVGSLPIHDVMECIGLVAGELGDHQRAASAYDQIAALRAQPEPEGEVTVSDVVRKALHIPPMAEQDMVFDFAAARGALAGRNRTDARHGAPSDADHAEALEKLWERILSAIKNDTPIRARGDQLEPEGARDAAAQELRQVCYEFERGHADTADFYFSALDRILAALNEGGKV